MSSAYFAHLTDAILSAAQVYGRFANKQTFSVESLILADFAEEWRECKKNKKKNKAGWLKRVGERK